MGWLGDVWAWFLVKFDEDPAGWISLGILVVGVIVASFWGRRFFRWIRRLPERYRDHMRRKYAPQTPAIPPPRGEVAVTFVKSRSPSNTFVDMYGARQGGTIVYRAVNMGPGDALDVEVELVAPALEAVSRLHWSRLEEGAAEEFVVHIPHRAARDALVRWTRGGSQFDRDLLLPLGKHS